MATFCGPTGQIRDVSAFAVLSARHKIVCSDANILSFVTLNSVPLYLETLKIAMRCDF